MNYDPRNIKVMRRWIIACLVIALISFGLWFTPLLMTGESSCIDLVIGVSWFLVVAILSFFVRFLERRHYVAVRTVYINHRKGFCRGTGSFFYDNVIDLVEQVIKKMVNADRRSDLFPLPQDFSAAYAIKTLVFSYEFPQNVSRRNKLGFHPVKDLLFPDHKEAIASAREVRVVRWEGSVVSYLDGEERRFASVDDLEDILNGYLLS